MDRNFWPAAAAAAAAALSVLLLTTVAPSSGADSFLEPYDLLYNSGVQAFYSGEYADVVRYMEAALSSQAEVRSTRVRCRLRCQDQHPFDDTFSELRFFDVVLHRAACMNRCIEDKLGAQSLHKVSEDVAQDFHRRIPYNYLQLAYQKLKQPEKAAAAAHTYFQANPEHVEMGPNLEQYRDQQDVQEVHFVDQEARPHQHSFTEAVKLYDVGDYEGAIVLFEEALVEYYTADVECRALCQGPQKFEGHDHVQYRYSLHELISDHFTQVLHCEHECVRDLATRPGRLSTMENYLPLHYDYLQFAYFQVDMLQEALECALTYLLFHKEEEFMTDNVDYYREVLGRDGSPREKADWYLRRHKQEQQLLLAGSEVMGVTYTEGNYWSSTGGRNDTRIPSGTDGWMEYVPISDKRDVSVVVPQKVKEGGPLLYDGVQLVQTSADLNGTQRVLLDHVISEDECAELRQLAHVVTMGGDGYRGRMSPHTPNEKFEGATVLKTLQYGYEGRVPMKSARLFYHVSERARRIVESYFLLNSTLHFSYTHLVCRTAIIGQQDHRNDLSHPIHADNCLLDPDANECWKEPPAYTYRDYSALLYLNGDFEGGEFIFTEMDAKTVTASVKPRCGRLVGFSSGGENPHGVKAITSGQRCAVALWFTLDPLYRELERLQADEVIQALDTQPVWGHGLSINPKDEL
ncbi:prolyl 3-hydroxylase 2 isoform X2 [Cynoglossus semilaevis]|uniref:procollagen-proline 3-dioxygenase n=1 Tax=Cynoglossus semilaevis TaxID=244447 RepID=A0A3P8WAD2_CYNSE|nr:prolyl 3-hydroxylase 2 isoform X2 [Cynoglossus semilaevis]